MAVLVAILSAIVVYLPHSSDASMLQDSDTAVLLQKIHERHDPLSWFRGDWPLENHFYRPIATLTFEWDEARSAGNAAGFGQTNALICALCVLLLAWFLRELTDRPFLTAGSTALFAIWNRGLVPAPIFGVLQILMFAALIGGIWRRGTDWRAWITPTLLWVMVSFEIANATDIAQRTLFWLPGRTATTMTVFCLLALAAYARYERLGAVRSVPEPGPLDPPATRNTRIEKGRPSALWAVLSVLGVAAALATYEQAVMLPACLVGVACAFKWRGFRVRWSWQFAYWALLVGYLVLRQVVLPHTPSRYQEQQFRNGPGVALSLLEYVFPSAGNLQALWGSLDAGWLLWLTAGPYGNVLAFLRDINTLLQVRRQWVMAACGYGFSVLAFLPMAWLNPFEHYHYWPLAMRSLFVMVLAWIAWERTVSAWSPRGLASPPRRDPAPGSLPRP